MDLVNREDVIWITKETGALDTQRRVKELPAVGAVPVVRCKDCKYWHNGDCYRLGLSSSHDFCSYGEKKGEEK